MCEGAVSGAWLKQFSLNNPGKPVTIEISSGGGYVISGLRLFDYLVYLRDRKKHRITMVVLGQACSMAGILFQAASKNCRFMGANSRLMIHEMSSGDYGKTTDRKESLAVDVKLEKRLLEILASRSKLSLRKIAVRWRKTDWWLNAQEAIDDGFADAIW